MVEPSRQRSGMPPSDERGGGAAHRLYVHLAWSTLGRVAVIERRRRAAIETHVIAVCRRLGVEPVEVRAFSDRVHLLAGLPATLSVHDVAVAVRDGVSGALARAGRVVRWTPGFAAVTVSPAEVRRLRKRLAMLEDRPPGVPIVRRRTARPGARGRGGG